MNSSCGIAPPMGRVALRAPLGVWFAVTISVTKFKMTAEQQMQYRTLGRTSLNVSVLGFGASPLVNALGDHRP